jgi:uncharacterized protein YjbJ (UPF0337 family)
MDRDRVIGSATSLKGNAKVAIARMIGDAKPETQGEAEKVEGKVQNAAGGIKDIMRNA